jgi:hypothetical protein
MVTKLTTRNFSECYIRYRKRKYQWTRDSQNCARARGECGADSWASRPSGPTAVAMGTVTSSLGHRASGVPNPRQAAIALRVLISHILPPLPRLTCGSFVRCFVACFNPEDGGTTARRNVSQLLPDYTGVMGSTRLENTASVCYCTGLSSDGGQLFLRDPTD